MCTKKAVNGYGNRPALRSSSSCHHNFRPFAQQFIMSTSNTTPKILRSFGIRSVKTNSTGTTENEDGSPQSRPSKTARRTGLLHRVMSPIVAHRNEQRRAREIRKYLSMKPPKELQCEMEFADDVSDIVGGADDNYQDCTSENDDNKSCTSD